MSERYNELGIRFEHKYKEHDFITPYIINTGTLCFDAEDICGMLNRYDELQKQLTLNEDLHELLGLMTDNNLTWKSVTNIIKEALP